MIIAGRVVSTERVEAGPDPHRGRADRGGRPAARPTRRRIRRRLPDLRRHGRHPHPRPRRSERQGDVQGGFLHGVGRRASWRRRPRGRHAEQSGRADRRCVVPGEGRRWSKAATCRSRSRSMRASGRARGRCRLPFRIRSTWGRASATFISRRSSSSTGRWPSTGARMSAFTARTPCSSNSIAASRRTSGDARRLAKSRPHSSRCR